MGYFSIKAPTALANHIIHGEQHDDVTPANLEQFALNNHTPNLKEVLGWDSRRELVLHRTYKFYVIITYKRHMIDLNIDYTWHGERVLIVNLCVPSVASIYMHGLKPHDRRIRFRLRVQHADSCSIHACNLACRNVSRLVEAV